MLLALVLGLLHVGASAAFLFPETVMTKHCFNATSKASEFLLLDRCPTGTALAFDLPKSLDEDDFELTWTVSLDAEAAGGYPSRIVSGHVGACRPHMTCSPTFQYPEREDADVGTGNATVITADGTTFSAQMALEPGLWVITANVLIEQDVPPERADIDPARYWLAIGDKRDVMPFMPVWWFVVGTALLLGIFIGLSVMLKKLRHSRETHLLVEDLAFHKQD